MSLDQLAIAFTGVIAIWLTQDARAHWRRWACVFGMCAQPFWFYATWRAGQWGIFALSFLYTYAWWRGLWSQWLKPHFDRRKIEGTTIRGLIVVALSCMAIGVCLTMCTQRSYARDLGQWENADPAIAEWYRSLMQPDNPQVSCCGPADAYWADGSESKDGKFFAIITDDRPDDPLGRPHIDVGTRIEVPPNKLKFDRGNPTGHTIIFIGVNGMVYCFVQGTLI